MLRGVGTLAAFGLLAYLLSQQGWGEVWGSVQRIAWWRFLVAAVLMAVSRLAVMARWHTLLRAAGVPVPLRQSARITFAGLFAANFLPTTVGGDVVRLALVLRLGYDKVVAAASLVVDRLVGMAGMGSAALLGAGTAIGAGDPAGSGERVIAAASLIGARWVDRVRHIVRRLSAASALWVRSPRGLLAAFGFTWVHQLCIFGVSWLMLGGMGEGISFWLVGGLWSFTYFVTLLPVSINGLGVQELSMTFIFSRFGGVSVAAAASAALLVRTLQMLASTPGAAFLPDIVARGGNGER